MDPTTDAQRLAALRREYRREALTEETAGPDPIALFRRWFDQAVAAGIHEPNAMAVATAGADGRPAVRMLLLKGLDERGFVFYTNYESRKGHELAANPWAALCFWWGELERQVRVEGPVEKVSPEESDAYFATRPRESQLGAWASPQSQVVADRAALEERLREAEARFAGGPVPRPPHWGGYRVVPQVMEFWQGRPGRLHDRLRYRREGDVWVRERLAP